MVQFAFFLVVIFAASTFAYLVVEPDGTVTDINAGGISPVTMNPLSENVVRPARAADPGHHGFGHGYDHHHHHHDYDHHYHGHGHDHYNHGEHRFHGGYDDYDYGYYHHPHQHNHGGYDHLQGNSYSQASAKSAAFNTPSRGFSVASAEANYGFGGFGGFF